MAEKLVRMFPLHCCRKWIPFVIDDFGHNNRMTLVCHRHPEPVVKYITWKQGIDKPDFDKQLEEEKKKKADEKANPKTGSVASN